MRNNGSNVGSLLALFFSEKIQSLGQRWNGYAKGYTSRGATRFRHVSNIYIYIYIYVSDRPQTPDVYLGVFPDDTCIYATDRKEDYFLMKLQRGLTVIETYCEQWNKNQWRPRPSTFLTDIGPLRLILHSMDGISPRQLCKIEMTETKAFRTFITIYSLFESER
jgi:hypothetical protein